MLVEYLESLLGKNNVAAEKCRDVVFPLYLNCYVFQEIYLYKGKYVFVKAKDKLNLRSYKAQKDKIEQTFGCAAVLVLNDSRSTQRQNLIANNIMFVEIGKQLFMPMSGIVLKNEHGHQKVEVEEFTPQIQLCALFFLYCDDSYYMVKQIAEKIKLNEMAISRGMKVLEELKIVASESKVRTKYYRRCVTKVDYWEQIEKYAISPIWRSWLTLKGKQPQNSVESGYSALSAYSIIADNDYKTYAISKEIYKQNQEFFHIVQRDLIYEQDSIELEVWKYDPMLFAEYGIVDKFSLYMSLVHGQNDERTEAILKEIKESIVNG